MNVADVFVPFVMIIIPISKETCCIVFHFAFFFFFFLYFIQCALSTCALWSMLVHVFFYDFPFSFFRDINIYDLDKFYSLT